MSILAVVDKKGRIQYNRMTLLAQLRLDLDIEVAALDDFHPMRKKYDVVYYAHFSLFTKVKIKGKRAIIGSVTSHKCLENFKDTVKQLQQFDRISVNNLYLVEAFQPHIKHLYYTPNGVDTTVFGFCDKVPKDKLVFGWVSNIDRATKNYKTIMLPLMKCVTGIEFKIIATSKKDAGKKLKNCEQMANYYATLDWILVTSSTEGTSNSFLESHAAGIPAISTRVGNTIEIMEDEKDGFFVDDNINAFRRCIDKVKLLNKNDYSAMRHAARKAIMPWDWKLKAPDWINFLSC